MHFQTGGVTANGEYFRLRELSAGAVEAAQAQDGETRQGYALIALSVLDGQGVPLYSVDQLEAGIAWVRALPMSVALALTAAVQKLNGASLDDARGN